VLLRSSSFMVGDNKGDTKVSMKLMDSVAPARVEAGAVVKADQIL
jgi:hypothetical protein